VEPEVREKVMEMVHLPARALVKEEQEWLAAVIQHPNFIMAWRHVVQGARDLSVLAMSKSVLGNPGELEKFIRDQGEFRASLTTLDKLMDLATQGESE
jgi:hypothetical protein